MGTEVTPEEVLARAKMDGEATAVRLSLLSPEEAIQALRDAGFEITMQVELTEEELEILAIFEETGELPGADAS